MAKASRSREAALGAGRLSEEAVVDAALALIAERGLEGLSMRALGERVGVEAMSLYHWFPAKERLLDAVADRLLAKVEMPPLPSTETWRDWLTAVARSYRRVALVPSPRLPRARSAALPFAGRPRLPASQYRRPCRGGVLDPRGAQADAQHRWLRERHHHG